MNCEICGCNPRTIYCLPIKKEDGCLNTMACLKCATESGHFCPRHDVPHLGFIDDNTTACQACIEEMVRLNAGRDEMIYQRIVHHLSNSDRADLIEAAQTLSHINRQPITKNILRFVATRAMRRQTSLNDIIEEIVKTGNVELLLARIPIPSEP